MEGTLRSWQIDEGLAFDLKNKFSFEAQHQEEYKLYEKDFRNRETDLTLGYNTREWQSAEVTYGFGKNFDFDFQLVGLVQLAYQKGTARFGERGNQGHTLFFKIAYMF